MHKLLNKFRLLPVVLLVILAVSCSNYQKILKSPDNEYKLQKAIEYYEDEDYNRAIGLLTEVIPAFRGTQKAEDINYYYAMAHFQIRDYTLASHYFKSFVSAFPASEHAEEFLYLSAFSKYLESPRSSLDQSSTREAIAELQDFVNRYPNSVRVEDANNLIDELRQKLEKKVFQNGMLYFNISDFRAAATTFNTLIKDYPDTQYREEALFYIVRSNFEYAQMSIQARQLERYKDVVEAFNNLLKYYPETQYLTEAQRMYDTAVSEISRLESIEEITENN